MEIFCKELNKKFDSKYEMFKKLKENKEQIIALKKSAVKNVECHVFHIKDESINKNFGTKKLEYGDILPVAMNTIYYLDYDLDLLIKGAWDRTAKEQNGKTYHLINHSLAIGSVVAYPKDVTTSVKEIEWKKLGKNYSGTTDVLVFESKLTEKTNKDAFLAYRDEEDIQHSIRLQYISIDLAFKSDEPEDKQENKLYEKYYPEIVNKDFADEHEYFWVVSEAKIYREGSTVLLGANEATPALYPKFNKDTVICQECGFSFDYNSIDESGIGYVKCPDCESVVTQQMKSEPPSSTRKKNNEPLASTHIDYQFLRNEVKNLKIN